MANYTIITEGSRTGRPLRYAAEILDGRVIAACGPLDRLEGLGTRAARALVCDATRRRTTPPGTAARLESLLPEGAAEIVAVPDVVRVRVGVMGGSLDDDVDAHRFAVAWTDRIRAAYGVDDVCVACTVNLRGLPPRDHCTAYWTADGVRHDSATGADLRPLTVWCWDAALDEVRRSAR